MDEDDWRATHDEAGGSPVPDDEAPHAVQAGAAAALLGMAAWRLEEALAADDETARAIARRVSERLAAPELAAPKAALRGLLLLLDPAHAPARGDDDLALVRLLIERSKGMLTAEPLERGAWAILRLLAGADGRRALIADIAGLHGVPVDLVTAALRRLEAEGCIVLEPSAAGASDGAALARLTDHGARRAADADPLPAFTQLLQEGFDSEGLWNLVQLGAALLQSGEENAATSRVEHSASPFGLARPSDRTV